MDYTIVICLFVSINSFLVGYIVGSKSRPLENYSVGSKLFTKDNNRESTNKDTVSRQSISIDTSKVVIPISTDSLERKYTQLGDIKTSDENISSSIDKLKNLKK